MVRWEHSVEAMSKNCISNVDTKNNRIDIHVIIFIHITLYISMIIKLERVDANINISIQLCNYTHASSAPADERERCVCSNLCQQICTR